MRQSSASRFPSIADSGGAQESETQSPSQLHGACFIIHASFLMSWLMSMQHDMPRARMWSARDTEIGPEPGLAEACSAARVPNRYTPAHAAYAACHRIPC